MEVLTRSKCPECEGAGVVASRNWAEFYEVENRSKGPWASWEVKAWFRNRGYDGLPPEEPTCQSCEGAGTIERWMDTQEILKAANITG